MNPMDRVLNGQDRLITVKEAAQRLGLCRSTVFSWFWEGKIRGVKFLGNRGPIRIFESEIKRIAQVHDLVRK